MVTRLFLNNKKTMKKIILIIAAIITSATLNAQDKDVTKFLGIPVDGTKAAMIQKLKAKGYHYNSTFDCLEGEFNGTKVNLFVVTNNNKVYRIMVADANYQNEADIKIRFNTLCNQFQNNNRYYFSGKSQTLAEDEKISYEMAINKKRYEAVFYQRENSSKTEDGEDFLLPTFMKSVWFMITEQYGKYGIIMFYDNGYNRANGEDL